MKSIRTHDLSDASSSVCDEDLILHKAVGILRKHIGDLVIESSEYTSPTDTSLSHSLNVMPPVLKIFLCWLLDDVAYDTVNKDHTIPPEKLRKCMALAETIVSINKNSFTPFSLGLALQMHHVYGSENLVETLHSHGFYASYNELDGILQV
jgi:hypothetical protein